MSHEEAMNNCTEMSPIKCEPTDDDDDKLYDVLPKTFIYEPISPASPLDPILSPLPFQHSFLTASAKELQTSLERGNMYLDNLNGMAKNRLSRKGRKSGAATKKGNNATQQSKNKNLTKNPKSDSYRPQDKENLPCLSNEQFKTNADFCSSLFTEATSMVWDLPQNAQLSFRTNQESPSHLNEYESLVCELNTIQKGLDTCKKGEVNGETQDVLSQSATHHDAKSDDQQTSISHSRTGTRFANTKSRDELQITIPEAISLITSKVKSGEINFCTVMIAFFEELNVINDPKVAKIFPVFLELQLNFPVQSKIPTVVEPRVIPQASQVIPEVSTVKPVCKLEEDIEGTVTEVFMPLECDESEEFISSKALEQIPPTSGSQPRIPQISPLELVESDLSILNQETKEAPQNDSRKSEVIPQIEPNLLILNKEPKDTTLDDSRESEVMLQVESNLSTPILENSALHLVNLAESNTTQVCKTLRFDESTKFSSSQNSVEAKLVSSIANKLDLLKLSKSTELNSERTTKSPNVKESTTNISQSSNPVEVFKTLSEFVPVRIKKEPSNENETRKIDKADQTNSIEPESTTNKRSIFVSIQTDHENLKNRPEKATTPPIVAKRPELKAKRSKSCEDTNLSNCKLSVKSTKVPRPRSISSEDEIDLDQLIPNKKRRKSKETDAHENVETAQQKLTKTTGSNRLTKPTDQSSLDKKCLEPTFPVKYNSKMIFEKEIVMKLPRIPKKSISIDDSEFLEEKRVNDKKLSKDTNKSKTMTSSAKKPTKLTQFAKGANMRKSECEIASKDLLDKVDKSVHSEEIKFVRTLLSIPTTELSNEEELDFKYINEHYNDADQVLPYHFQSAEQYKAYFASLIFYETWANICKKYRGNIGKKSNPCLTRKVVKDKVPTQIDQMCCVQFKGSLTSAECRKLKSKYQNWIGILRSEQKDDEFMLCFIKRQWMEDDAMQGMISDYINLIVYVDFRHKRSIEQETTFTITPIFNLYFVLAKIATMSKIEAKPDLLKSIISPKRKNFCNHKKACNQDFKFIDHRDYNVSQQRVIISGYNMIHQKSENHSRENFVLVHGESGTGKTYALVGLIKNLFLNGLNGNNKEDNAQRILVCAPSNKSLDDISRRLLHLRNQLTQVYATPRTIRVVRLDKVDQTDASVRELLLSELLKNPNEQCPSSHNLQCNASRDTSTGNILKKADVILSTFNTLLNSDRSISSKLQSKEIALSCLIVDDASHCIEPEFLKPLTFPSVSKVIMFGDNHHHTITLVSKKAQEGNLARSLFERFYLSLDDTARHKNVVIGLSKSTFQEHMPASKITLRNPTITLFEIGSQIDPTQLVPQIIKDNPQYDIDKSEIAVITARNCNSIRKEGYDAYLTVSPSLFSRINKKILKVGDSLPTVSETFYVTQCSHCVDMGHSTGKCPNHTSNPQKYHKRCRTCSTILTSPTEFKTHLRSRKCLPHCHVCEAKEDLDAHHRPLSDQCQPFNQRMAFLRNNTNYDSSCHSPVIATVKRHNSGSPLRFKSKPLPDSPKLSTS